MGEKEQGNNKGLIIITDNSHPKPIETMNGPDEKKVRHINEKFPKKEWARLTSEKKRRGVTWHDFIMELAINKKERLKQIIVFAQKLGWIQPPNNTSYPLMQVSEKEKCMIAMYDNFEIERMKKWAENRGGTVEAMGSLPESNGKHIIGEM